MGSLHYKEFRIWHLGATLCFVVGALLFVTGTRETEPLYFVAGSLLYAAGMALLWKVSRVVTRRSRRTEKPDGGAT